MKQQASPFCLVAIDGPTGVGKSTITRQLAGQQNYLYVDTGAMFRCIAWNWKQHDMPTEEEAITKLVKETQIELRPDGRVICNDTDITDIIREESISQLASKVSQFSAVRDMIMHLQRQLVENVKTKASFPGAVLEGRDIGTSIFPNADRKFFLVADPEIRAQRRYQQLLEKGADVTFEEVRQALEDRDRQDKNRALSPLKPAEDAIHVDSSNLSIDEVVQTMIRSIKEVC